MLRIFSEEIKIFFIQYFHNMSTIFSKIIAGKIPSYRIYEDDYVYAFLDVFPQQDGHTLIVPKYEVDHFSQMSEPYATALFLASQKISQAIQKATNCDRVCASFVGYEIPHCHFHLVPTNSIGEATFREVSRADEASLRKMQSKILSYLNI